jgi:hypothetical protein
MRTIARILINLGLLAATAVTGGWLTTQKVYLHATKDARTAMLVGVAGFFFVIACVALNKLKVKKPQAQRTAYPYATAGAKRGK